MAKSVIFYLKSGAIITCPKDDKIAEELASKIGSIGDARTITVKTQSSTVIIPTESISFVEIKEEDKAKEQK